MVGYDGYGAPIYVHQLPPVVKFLPVEPDTHFTNERIDNTPTQGFPILSRFDVELAGFKWEDVKNAYRMEAR